MTMTPLLAYVAGVAMGSVATGVLLWPRSVKSAPVEDAPEPVSEPVESDDAKNVRAALDLMSFNAVAPASNRRPVDTAGLSERAGHWLAGLDLQSSEKMLAAMRRSTTAWEDHRDGVKRVTGVPPVELLPTYLRKKEERLKGVPDILARTDRIIREAFDD